MHCDVSTAALCWSHNGPVSRKRKPSRTMLSVAFSATLASCLIQACRHLMQGKFQVE